MHPTVWPSGLRRWLQAPVRKGVGSNPTAVTLLRLKLPADRQRPHRTGATWRCRPADHSLRAFHPRNTKLRAHAGCVGGWKQRWDPIFRRLGGCRVAMRQRGRAKGHRGEGGGWGGKFCATEHGPENPRWEGRRSLPSQRLGPPPTGDARSPATRARQSGGVLNIHPARIELATFSVLG